MAALRTCLWACTMMLAVLVPSDAGGQDLFSPKSYSSITGVCAGTPDFQTCSSCAGVYGCANCVGCSNSTGCFGEATGCYLFSGDLNACRAQGCDTFDGLVCFGVPTSCESRASQQSCQLILGCSWSTQCTGTITDCEQLQGAAACQSQLGCIYTSTPGTCSGTLDFDTCAACAPVYGCANCVGCSAALGLCTGTMTPCSQITVDDDCERQMSCVFTPGDDLFDDGFETPAGV